MKTVHATETYLEDTPCADIERKLDRGELEVAMANGNWWRGKTRPTEFRIPIKVGFRTCGAITHEWREGVHYRFAE
jgi:hypothetical protein